jgi:hypothetical protein
MKYTCPRCGYETSRKSSIIDHYKRKRLCDPKLQDLPLDYCVELLYTSKGELNIIEKLEKENLHLKHILDYEKIEKEKIMKELIEVKKQLVIEQIKNKPIIQKKKSDTKGFIYIIHEREFVNSGNNIYKIGKTKSIKNRMSGYSKNSDILDITSVENCLEAERYLIYKFKDHYINRTDIGNEYFQGDVSSMVKLIHEYSLNDDNVFEQE